MEPGLKNMGVMWNVGVLVIARALAITESLHKPYLNKIAIVIKIDQGVVVVLVLLFTI